MPMYQYECTQCGVETEVLRSFSQYEKPPTDEETPQVTRETEKKCNHSWTRIIGGKQSLIRGPGWRGAKGYWGKV